MCVRYNTIDERWERYLKRKGVWIPMALPPAQLEMFPGYVGQIVVAGEGGRLELIEAKWGLQPPWSKDVRFGVKNCYNARIEGREELGPGQRPGIENTYSYREPFKKWRCLVPMASYYENADMPKAKAAGCYVEVFPTEDEAFMMAGLWQPPEPKAEDQTPTFVILTTASNGDLAEVHSRRLARLEDEDMHTWLDPEAPWDLLKAIVHPRDQEPIRLQEAEKPRRPSKAKATTPKPATTRKPKTEPEEPTLF